MPSTVIRTPSSLDEPIQHIEWMREARAGLIAALGLFATDVGYGWIAFAPLGLAFSNNGIVAAFLAAAIGSIVPALIGGAGPLSGSARPAQTLIFASLLASLLPAAGQSMDAPRLLVAGALCVALAGVFQIGFGYFGVGRAIKYTPMPVLAGFTNGVALSMALSALGSLLLGGLPGEVFAVQGATRLAFVVALLVLMYAAFRALPQLHWSLVGLVAGVALYCGMDSLGWANLLGGTLPEAVFLHPTFPVLLGLEHFTGMASWWRDLPVILVPALTIATINSLEALVIASQQDLLDGTRHDSDRVLIGQGLGNLLGGLLGALPVAPSNSRQKISRQAGGKTRATSVFFGLAMLVLLFVIPPYVHWIPRIVIAAILLYMAFAIFDDWTQNQLMSWLRGKNIGGLPRQMLANLVVMATVMVVAVLINLLAAVAVGVTLSMFLFVRHHSRSIIARVYRGGLRHSTVMRMTSQMDVLKRHGEEIALVELEGPLFFGSGDPLMDELERLAATARQIILDFRQVGDVELSGAAAIQRSAMILRRRGVTLLLAEITPDCPRGRAIMASSLINHLHEEHWFEDADFALEAAEDALLLAHGAGDMGDSALPWREMEALAGLTQAQIETLLANGQQISWRRGDIVFSRDDPGDTVYLLAAGRVEIRIPRHGNGGIKRLVALHAGTVFGELAVLRDIPRSADAVVSSERAEALALTRAQLNQLRETHAEIAMTLFRNIGCHMAVRLASVSEELRYALVARG